MEPTILLDILPVRPPMGTFFWGYLVLIVLPLLIGGIALVRWLSGEPLNGQENVEL